MDLLQGSPFTLYECVRGKNAVGSNTTITFNLFKIESHWFRHVIGAGDS